jgi:DNA-binding MarR family transcriptional regulator
MITRMHGDSTKPDDLGFWSFVDYAVDQAHERLPDVDPLAMRLVMTLHRVAGMVVYDVESTVHRPRGWSWPGFRAMFCLWLAAPVEAKKVAELTGMSRAAVSALVATLERDGLVAKGRAPHDGRAVQLTLTDKGSQSIASDFDAHNSREREWAAALTEAEQRTLIRLLDKLAAHSARFGARHRA